MDDEDYEWLNQYTWYLDSFGYLVRSSRIALGKYKYTSMHREIMNAPKGMVVDHKNHNIRDNQKKNLRICTRSENAMNSNLSKNNSSGVTGVKINKLLNKWSSSIQVNRKMINLGTFINFEDAVKARKDAEIKYFGEFRNNMVEISEDKFKENTLIKTSHSTPQNYLSSRNTSGKRGVCWVKESCNWRAYITVDKITYQLGFFEDFEDAKNARINAEIKFGLVANN